MCEQGVTRFNTCKKWKITNLEKSTQDFQVSTVCWSDKNLTVAQPPWASCAQKLNGCVRWAASDGHPEGAMGPCGPVAEREDAVLTTSAIPLPPHTQLHGRAARREHLTWHLGWCFPAGMLETKWRKLLWSDDTKLEFLAIKLNSTSAQTQASQQHDPEGRVGMHNVGFLLISDILQLPFSLGR